MKTVTIAANITYSGFTYNTPLVIEYEHTGKQWFYTKGKTTCFTENESIANDRKASGKKVVEKQGYYYIKRLAIPTINDKGEKIMWYINNPGDHYSINKVSKYGQKIHSEMSKEQPPL